MDDRKRELERRLSANPHDIELRSNLKLQIGETPSWDYLLDEWGRARELQRQYLSKAVEEELAAFFQKHPVLCGIDRLSWGIYPRADCGSHDYTPDNWEIEGLSIDIGHDLWGEHCQATPHGGLDFEPPTLISHLKKICDCTNGRGDPRPISDCSVGFFEWIEDDQKLSLRLALEDVLKIAKKLDRSQRSLISADAVNFIYNRNTGFQTETYKELQARFASYS